MVLLWEQRFEKGKPKSLATFGDSSKADLPPISHLLVNFFSKPRAAGGLPGPAAVHRISSDAHYRRPGGRPATVFFAGRRSTAAARRRFCPYNLHQPQGRKSRFRFCRMVGWCRQIVGWHFFDRANCVTYIPSTQTLAGSRRVRMSWSTADFRVESSLR
jgi:hypothetical protein